MNLRGAKCRGVGGRTDCIRRSKPRKASKSSAIQYIEALSYGLTGKECIQALAEEMMKLNDWLEKLGIKRTPLGIFQPEHPELPGAACVRTWSNSGSSDGKLWIPLREQVEKRQVEAMYEAPAKELIQTPSGGNRRHPDRGYGQALLHQGCKGSDSLLRRVRIRF